MATTRRATATWTGDLFVQGGFVQLNSANALPAGTTTIRNTNTPTTALPTLTSGSNVITLNTDTTNSLTTTNAASTPYTLRIMTWVAAIFTPVVLAYQAWTYWVFRKRIGLGETR